MNPLEKARLRLNKALYHRTLSIKEACDILDIEFVPGIEVDLEQCANCSIWYKEHELIEDVDHDLICDTCARWYGM